MKLLCRGNLNPAGKILIYNIYIDPIFYWNTNWNTAPHVTTRFAVNLTARFITMIGSKLPAAADDDKKKSTKSRSRRQDSGGAVTKEQVFESHFYPG